MYDEASHFLPIQALGSDNDNTKFFETGVKLKPFRTPLLDLDSSYHTAKLL